MLKHQKLHKSSVGGGLKIFCFDLTHRISHKKKKIYSDGSRPPRDIRDAAASDTSQTGESHQKEPRRVQLICCRVR